MLAFFMCFVGSSQQGRDLRLAFWGGGVCVWGVALCLPHGALEGALVPWHRSWSGVRAWQIPVAVSVQARSQRLSGVP